MHDLCGWLRAHGRETTTLIALVVCAFSAGYGLTGRLCDSDSQVAITVRTEPAADVFAQQQQAAALDEHALSGAALVQPSAASADSAAPRLGRAVQQGGVHNARVKARLKPSGRAVANATSPVAAIASPSHGDREPASAPDGQPITQLPAAAERPARTDPQLALPSDQNAATQSPVAAASPLVAASARELAPASTAASVSLQLVATDVHKVAAIEALYVEGSLPQSVVSRGVSRLLPQYERCSEFCDAAPQRLKLSARIDESGHGRAVVAEGSSRPRLRRCLEQATAHLAVPAPDTGTARARWIVRFANATR